MESAVSRPNEIMQEDEGKDRERIWDENNDDQLLRKSW